MTIIFILLFVVWCYSFYKFKKRMKYFTIMTSILIEQVRLNPNYMNRLRLSSALIEIQRYKDAYNILLEVQRGPTIGGINPDYLKMNIAFCENPIPSVNTPTNFNQSYWHNFILVRLGKRRCSFLMEDDYLLTNSILRNM